MIAAFITFLVLAAQQPAAHAATETYQSAPIDSGGNLRIVTSTHKGILISKKGQFHPQYKDIAGPQTAFENPVISPDHRAVGAQTMFGNCCTSYDMPLQLVIYAAGRTHRFNGSQAIFAWHFVDGSRRVAFSQQPVHFGCIDHWELHDIATEALVAQVDVPLKDPNLNCGPMPRRDEIKIPSWVSGSTSDVR